MTNPTSVAATALPSAITRFQFTWNNYTDANEVWLSEFFKQECTYLVYGKEVSPTTNTPHLQGFAILKKRQRISALSKKGFNAHLTPNDNKIHEAAAYCKKDGKVTEFGQLPSSQGTRSDLETFKAAVRSGQSWVTLLDEQGEIVKKYRTYCSEFYANFKPKLLSPEGFEERVWHQLVIDAINTPCRRFIHFFIDETGGSGKSFMTKHLYATREDVQIFKPEKEANLALMLDETKSVFIFDVPRCRSNMDIPFPYQLLEGLKDGLLVSGKYESRMKEPKTPNTVIVFANSPPDPDTLSNDRFKVWAYIPGLKTFGKCELNAGNSWDLLHPTTQQRLKVIENPQFEKKCRKRKREQIQDELLALRLKKEQDVDKERLPGRY